MRPKQTTKSNNMNYTSKKSLSALVATVCILGAATERAGAVASITLFDGTNTITVTDGGVNDASSMLGVVVFNGTIGIWDINVSPQASDASD